ncbi:MAG: hypothetical protein M3R27_09940 [Bacteroidota bacterium]|nr:hypothetical protein [Bacteroidota bacterium]
MNRLYPFLLLIITLSSCKQEPVFTEVKVNERYSIQMPDYLQPCVDLHKDASLQYQNLEKDIYAMVIDEKKITMEEYSLDYDLDLYFNSLVSQPFMESIQDGKVSPPGRQKIDGHKALVAEITGKIDKYDVYYRLGLIETPYEFYQILIWTRAQNKEQFEPDMIRMIESFKELPHPKEELPQPKLSDSVVIAPAW